jgi:hypothetical protein
MPGVFVKPTGTFVIGNSLSKLLSLKVLSFSKSELFFVDKTNLSPIDCLCVKMNYLWCCYCLNVTIYVSKIAEH